MLKILIKAITKSFLDRLIRRENTVLSEWCSFSSARYVRGFYYVVVDFLRGNLIVRSGEENLEPPTYRTISPPPPIYQTTKPYLIVADLYMRYASLSKPQARSKITRTMTVLPTMSIQNLYEKFHGKEKRIIPTPSRTLDSPTKQHATRQNLGHAVFERFGFIRSLPKSTPRLHSSISSKSIAQGLTIQQQRHIKSIKHDALPDICIDDVRSHTLSPADLAVAVKTPAQYRTYGIPAEKGMNTSAEHMRRSNKV